MNRKTIYILTIGLLIILMGIWAYPKVDQFFKVDSCLDQGGRWNYETQECEFSEPKEISETNEIDSLYKLLVMHQT